MVTQSVVMVEATLALLSLGTLAQATHVRQFVEILTLLGLRHVMMGIQLVVTDAAASVLLNQDMNVLGLELDHALCLVEMESFLTQRNVMMGTKFQAMGEVTLE